MLDYFCLLRGLTSQAIWGSAFPTEPSCRLYKLSDKLIDDGRARKLGSKMLLYWLEKTFFLLQC